VVFEEELHIHYITTGKLYTDVKTYVGQLPEDGFGQIAKNKAVWRYTEFAGKLKSWGKFRRCIFTTLQCDQTGQTAMDFDKPDNIIYTNIGNCPKADKRLKAAGGSSYFDAGGNRQEITSKGRRRTYTQEHKRTGYQRAAPFQILWNEPGILFLARHCAFYVRGVQTGRDHRGNSRHRIPACRQAGPNTFRRKLIDFAVKITSHARDISVNVAKTVYQCMNIEKLWKLCQSPPPIALC
jgi:hypothetical protein